MAVAERTFLPAFADGANRAAGDAIEGLRASLRAADEQLAEHTDTIAELSAHVARSHREVDFATRLLLERSARFSVEEHLHQLEARQLGGLAKELEALRGDERSAGARCDSLAQEAARQQQAVEAFREAREWSEGQLRQWAALTAQREEDGLALQLYHRRDEATIKQLSLELQRASRQSTHAIAAAADVGVEAAYEEAGLAAALKALERCKSERNKLAEQQDRAQLALQKQETGLADAASAVEAKQAQLAGLQEEHERMQQDLGKRLAGIKQAEKEVETTERLAQKLRDAAGAGGQQLRELDEAVARLLAELVDLDHEQQQQVAAAESARRQVASLDAELQGLRNQGAELQESLEAGGQQAGDAAGNAASLQALCEAEKKRLHRLATAEAAANAARATTGQRLRELQEESKRLQAQLGGASAEKRALGVRLANAQHLAAQQAEAIYHARFRLVALDREAGSSQALAAAASSRAAQERASAQTAVRRREAQLLEAQAAVAALQGQAQDIEAELGCLRRQGAEQAAEAATLRSQLKSLSAEGDACERGIAAAVKDREARIVARDLLQVEVRRARGRALSQAAELSAFKGGCEEAVAKLQARLCLLQADRQGLMVEVKLVRVATGRLLKEVSARMQQARNTSARHATLRLKHAADSDVQAARAAEAAELQALRAAKAQGQAAVAETLQAQRGLEQALADAKASNAAFEAHVRSHPYRAAGEAAAAKERETELRSLVTLLRTVTCPPAAQ